MVRKIHQYIIAFIAFTTVTLHAQTTVTIGTGSGAGTASPIATWYNSSATESIYTAAEIGTTGYITTLAYQKMGGNSTTPLNVQIYIKTTTDTSVAPGTYIIGENFTSYVLVYEGQLPNSGNGWMQVTLQTPFVYTDTTRNLGILTVGSTCIESGRPQYAYTSSTGNRMSSYYNDGSIACGGNAPFNNTVIMRPVWERPNVRFTITSELGTETALSPDNKVRIFNNDGKLTVFSNTAALKNITAYNLQGRELYTTTTNSNELILSDLAPLNQLLLVKVTDVNNHTSTLKTLY